MSRPAEVPLLSVVLPVHGVERYLPACLDSVLADPAAGIEVIAVDDASPDGCGRLLDARAGQDPRLRVIHLPAPVGPGGARAHGLAAAAGEYVWFVDPDDLIAPGGLAAVAGRLIRDRPELLLIDYLMLHPSGRTEPSPGRQALGPAGEAAAIPGPPPRPGPGGQATALEERSATITLAQRPGLIDRTMTVWSKVFRRDFLSGLGVGFPAGIHEDVPVSCAALLRAGSIALLDRVCYLYRQREASFLAVPAMAHFAIFAAYEEVFALLEEPAGPAAAAPVRLAVFGRAMEHCATVLASGLIPPAARRDFFSRLTAQFRRHAPPGYRPPAGLRGIKMRLIRRGAYRAYLVLAPLNGARVGLRRVLGRR